MNIDNQKEYWDEVAEAKTFTHPLDLSLLQALLTTQTSIVDFGCGYGRVVKELLEAGFENVRGFDTSKELIARGITENKLPLQAIANPEALEMEDNSVDCILLFAVLTCIPSNEGQRNLIRLLRSKLKKGGLMYISDYYLQDSSVEVSRYEYLNNDQDNFGVFHLPEGATFRHHTRAWIKVLLADFEILKETSINVMTMNGNIATGFQLIIKK